MEAKIKFSALFFQRGFCGRHDISDFSSNGLTKLSPIRRFDNQALSVEIASEGCLGLVCDRPSLIKLLWRHGRRGRIFVQPLTGTQ